MRFSFGAMAGATLVALFAFGARAPIHQLPSRKVRSSSTFFPNGAKEVARRQRQIAKGMLKVSPAWPA